MRPLKGILVARGTVRCENGVTYNGLTIPDGVAPYDPVLVFYDLTQGRVAKVSAEVPEEELAEIDHHEEICFANECEPVEDDPIETDGSEAL